MNRLYNLLLTLFVYSLTTRVASGLTLPSTPRTSRHVAETSLGYRTRSDLSRTNAAVIDALIASPSFFSPVENTNKNRGTTGRLGRITNGIKRRLRLRRRSRSIGHERALSTTRLYSGVDGQSHIEPMTPLMDDFVDTEGAFGRATPWMSCDRMTIRQVPPGYDHSWHNAPRRQYIVQLQGSLEIEVASGAKAVIGPGDVLLTEDMTGQGHMTRQKGDGPCMYAVVVLDEDGVYE